MDNQSFLRQSFLQSSRYQPPQIILRPNFSSRNSRIAPLMVVETPNGSKNGKNINLGLYQQNLEELPQKQTPQQLRSTRTFSSKQMYFKRQGKLNIQDVQQDRSIQQYNNISNYNSQNRVQTAPNCEDDEQICMKNLDSSQSIMYKLQKYKGKDLSRKVSIVSQKNQRSYGNFTNFGSFQQAQDIISQQKRNSSRSSVKRGQMINGEDNNDAGMRLNTEQNVGSDQKQVCCPNCKFRMKTEADDEDLDNDENVKAFLRVISAKSTKPPPLLNKKPIQLSRVYNNIKDGQELQNQKSFGEEKNLQRNNSVIHKRVHTENSVNGEQNMFRLKTPLGDGRVRQDQ